jgi:integrase/recombinase XerD
MDQSIEQLGQDLARASYAKTTQERYVRTARELADRIRKPLVDVTREDLRAFVEFVGSRGMSPWQVRDRLSGVLFLFRRTLGRPELVSFIKLPRRHSPLPSVLSLEEVHALLQALRHRRYQAIAMVMYGAGLRISEAIALEVGDIDGSRGVVRVRHGKGDRRRPVCLRRRRPARCRERRRYERLSPERRRRRGSRNGSPRTCCVTRLRHTCSTRGPTCMSCVSCWATGASKPQLAMHA